MAANEMMKYDVDLVMCIDATGSMGPFLDLVKSQALSFYGDLKKKMAEDTQFPKNINQLRVRVIAFRDYLADGDKAMLTSPFYTLPDQAEEFEALVREIRPMGGGDAPEDALEALGYAIKSKWTPAGDNKRRQVIIVWTDDDAHEIGFSKKAANYPEKMAKSFAELTQWWGYGQDSGFMDDRAKRLLIYAPAKSQWNLISETWDNALLFPSQAGKGLDRLTYDEILSTLSNTL